MTDEEFRKMFTINKNIDDIPKEETPILPKEEVRRILENKQPRNTQTKQGIPTLIIIYLLLICFSVLGYFATQEEMPENAFFQQLLSFLHIK